MREASAIAQRTVPVLAVACLLLAGCGLSPGSGSPRSGQAGTVSLPALAKDVSQAAAIPNFSAYAAGYGSKITDPARLRGMKLMIIPGDSQLVACTEIAEADAAIATDMGMTATIFSDDGATADLNTGIETAIQQHYSAVDLGCDYDPTTTAAALAQAQGAGLAIAVYGATPQEAAATHITYTTTDNYAIDAKVAAEQAVRQHGGKPFDAIAFTSNASPATAILQDALTAELKVICRACKVTDVNVEEPDWPADLSAAVISSLTANPKVTVLFPDYAGMLAYLLAGVEGAHRTSDIKTYLAFGGGTPFIQLQTVEPGKSVIQSDIGGYPPWTGYLLFLQTARALEHMTAIPSDLAIDPDRVATPQNAASVLATGGWGTEWVNGFRGLLGLPALTGKALTQAATLNGAMVGLP
jgi:ABC-type sugar transport system substrate-binding protein